PAVAASTTSSPMGEEEWQYLFEGGPEPKARDGERAADSPAAPPTLPTGSLPDRQAPATR
ncbi:MAG TPA: hypothetical protein VL475_02645, partial [Planctomycetaceae bacterium]|nr:hypothetical protein [Planctomycetaceae bacterium]